MSPRLSIILVVSLAVIAGGLALVRQSQVITDWGPEDIRFGEINNLDYDPTDGVFEVTGPDPYGYLELPAHSIPLLDLKLVFAGAYRPGGWYIYPCPAHLKQPIINQDWVVTADAVPQGDDHALVWTFEGSQLARIDFPDELLGQPMTLKQASLTTSYESSRSKIYLGSILCGAAALLLLLIHLLTTFAHHPTGQTGIMLTLLAAKIALARNLGQTFMTQLLHDDRLFMNQGRSIFAGDWLGPFHEITLAKGPTFSVFLALSAASGWPLQFNILLFHGLACLVFVGAVSPWIVKPAWRILLFSLLLFDPFSMSAELIGRVLRSSIHPALTLLTFAGLLGMVTRADRTWLKLLPWTLLAGLAGAAFWYSREEGIWAVPSALLLTGTATWLAWRGRGARWAPLLLVLVLPVTVFWTAKTTVRAINHHYYGVWIGVDVLEGAFPDAYGAILRVENPDPLGGVPATRATRELIYAQSPTFALLREQMEGAMQEKWAFAGWHRQPPHERSETEIRGGWFPWALREAAARAGYYETAEQAETLWRSIAEEINTAVDEGRLRGGGPRSGFAPVWDNSYALPTIRNWFRAVDLVVRSQDFGGQGIPSRGTTEDIQMMAETYHANPVLAVGPAHADTRIRMMVNQIYHWIGWPLTALALFATGVLAVRSKKSSSARIVLAVLLAFWGGFTAIALVVAVVEATSFVAVIGAYLGPAAPLLIVAWVLAPYFAWVHSPADSLKP